MFQQFFSSVAETLVSKLPIPTGTFNATSVFNFYKKQDIAKDSFKLHVVDENEICNLLSKMNPCKATGLDNISAKFVRDGAVISTPAITYIHR